VYLEARKTFVHRFNVHFDEGPTWNQHGLSTAKQLRAATPADLKDKLREDEAFDEDDNIEPGPRPSRSRNPTPRFAPMFTFHTVQDTEEEITAPRANDSLCELAYKAFAATEAIASDVSTPRSFKEAMRSPQRDHWLQGTKAELASLRKFGVYSIKRIPPGAKLVQTKWVYRVKKDKSGNVERYKVRLVMKGFTQKPGIHFEATFAPVARLASFRTLLAIAAQHNLKLTQLDFTCAYLHSTLKEEIWAKPPPGIKVPPGYAWKLNKACYGLKQSGREWYRTLDAALRSLNMKRCHADPCLYIKVNPNNPDQMLILLIYVDDVTCASNWPAAEESLVTQLSQNFNVKHLGELKWFLGIEVEHDTSAGTIRISQPQYIEQMLKRFGFWGAKPQSTPADPNVPLTNLPSNHVETPDQQKEVQQFPYREVIGSLMYAACVTRPDIAATVGFLARAMSNPKHVHVTAAKRCLRYLKGTQNLGITYCKSEENQKLMGCSDSNWAGDDERKSTSGYCFMLSQGPMSWGSKKQRSVALSSCEAEYYAASLATQEAIWLRNLLAELQHGSKGATEIKEDNTGCIRLSKDPCSHAKSKHIEVRHHFVRDQVQMGKVNLVYIPTAENVADVFTKVLGKAKHTQFVAKLMSSK
jgi:hypothetical protein